MAVNKTPGEVCCVTVGSIDYIGPPVTVWICGMLAQGTGFPLSGLIYLSWPEQITFPASIDWVTVQIGLRIEMSPAGGAISSGLADAYIAIMATDLGGMTAAMRFAQTGEALYAQTWPGAFSFDYPASAWRGASGTFAAQVEGLEAQFGVMR